ncbi:MAG: ABC transporter substrate-binding protein [Syntrophobacteraceae bacterium]|nr:ABC transporter substrate-binding protein [Syntrophobacteraceae bacterium]
MARSYREEGKARNPAFGMFLVALMTGIFLGGCGEQKPGMIRVGILCGLDVFVDTVDGFRARMNELGYIEGKNISYDFQRTNFDPAAEEQILSGFVGDKVDLMLVFPSEVSVAAKRVTQGTPIPVVFCQTNIEGTNLIQTVAEPGGNITGVRYPGPDLALKRFEILRELAPRARRFWVPYTKHSPIVPSQLEVLRPAAAEAGVLLVESPADTGADLLADLESREGKADTGIDAVLLISEPLARTPAVFLEIGRFASRHRIPVGGVLYSVGGYSTVFGVATENRAVGKLAAHQVHKVLSGIPAGKVPVVSAESDFRFNYRVATELGLSVPTGLLKQADEVIR